MTSLNHKNSIAFLPIYSFPPGFNSLQSPTLFQVFRRVTWNLRYKPFCERSY